jgi:hypothetical protein
MAKGFSNAVIRFKDVTIAKIEAVFRQAAMEVIEEMQRVGPSMHSKIGPGDKKQGGTPSGGQGGHMPVDTGFLRASLVVSLNSPARSVTNNPGQVGAFTYNEGTTSGIILAAQFGDLIYAVYTANYARHVEYGAQGRPGYGFVRLAVQNWPKIVDKVARRVRAQAGVARQTTKTL